MSISRPIRAYAALGAGTALVPFEYDAGPLADDEIELRVDHCGICHSDLALIDSEWFASRYPLVPGHEVIGVITAMGAQVRGRRIGQRVGVGWHSASCMHCLNCVGGEQHLCGQRQPTIIGRHGGFADRLRAHWAWAIPIPDGLDAAAAGPLMCGGGTVFLPFVLHAIKPTDRVGVVGIGGLGHMALKFARAWGCEVTAFTSSASKHEEALTLGAHRVISSVDTQAMKAASASLDFLLITVGASLPWDALLGTLAAKGRMHMVGVVTEQMAIKSGGLLSWQRGLSASPTPPPAVLTRMLDFATRHQILPQVERFPMSRANDAIAHLRANQARYRIVLDADF